jgi:hypothetical protein
MLKFVVLLFFVGLVAAEDDFRWDSIPVVANTSQCVYRPELKILACRGTNVFVECPAVCESTRLGSLKFKVFGIGRNEIISETTPNEDTTFDLYPRNIENTTYLNSTVFVDEKPVHIVLYYNEKTTHAGLRVTDVKCYGRLIQNVFLNHIEYQYVTVESVTEKVGLIGEILIAEKPANRRWLGYGYPWYGGFGGYGGYGWGAGWGLPYYGLMWG